MAFQNAEIGKINQSALDAELGRWIEQDRLAVQGHPKETEYKRISEQAKSILERMSMALAMPAGFQILEQGAEQLGTLYEQAVTIRAAIAHDNIRSSFGVQPGQDLQTVLEADIDRAISGLGSGFSEPIRRDLLSLSEAFGVNPADTMQGNVPGNKFFMAFRGKTGVNFDQVDKARKTLDQLRAAGNTNPELAALANKFEAGLQQVEASDPFRAAHHKWYNESFGTKVNMKPLRVLGGLFGALVTTIGLGQTVFTKGHALSPATVGWGLITMLIVNPDLRKGNGAQALDQITALGTQNVFDLVNAGFKGPQGRAAFEELQAIRSSNSNGIKALQKSEEVSVAQVGALTDGVKTPLVTVLAGMPSKQRSAALMTFGGSMTEDQKEFTGQMLEARV